jgi:hypothetical protein
VPLYIWPAKLDFTVGGLKPISEGHSFCLAGAPYKYLYGGAPYKSPKIAEIAENRRKSELQADDLRGSLILLIPPTVKSSCAGGLVSAKREQGSVVARRCRNNEVQWPLARRLESPGVERAFSR